MKSITISFLTVLLTILFINTVEAQERQTDRPMVSPNAAVEQTIGLTEVAITYGRPSVNDRVIFGDLVPFGNPWRTGANESTVVTFSDDVLVEGESVEEGTYSLYSIPEEDGRWTIIINDKLSWGTEYDENEDVLRVEVDAEEAHFVEQMMIYFEDISEDQGTLVIHWADTKAPVTIEPVTD
ncbi:MAG: DUF2911 domain-containing protein [Balneolaceae bacterium]